MANQPKSGKSNQQKNNIQVGDLGTTAKYMECVDCLQVIEILPSGLMRLRHKEDARIVNVTVNQFIPYRSEEESNTPQDRPVDKSDEACWRYLCDTGFERFPRRLRPALGFELAGFLSYLINRWSLFKDKGKNLRGWFYLTENTVTKDSGASHRTQLRLFSQLEEMRIIQRRTRYAKREIRINFRLLSKITKQGLLWNSAGKDSKGRDGCWFKEM